MKNLLLSKNTYIKLNNISKKPFHSYIFFGPENIGKKTAAYHVASNLAHGSKDSNFIKQIASGISTNVTVVYSEEEKQGAIKISQIKKIIDEINLTPISKKYYRVVVINNIERLTEEASNSLLKSLEEPNHNIIFILTTNSLSKVLPTIISRSQLVSFTLPPQKEIFKFIMSKFKLAKEETTKIIKLSEGRVGLALKILENKNLKSQKLSILKLAYDFSDSGLTARFKIIKQITEDNQAYNFIRELILVYRDKILTNPNASISLDRLIECESQLMNNLNPRLALENLTFSMGQ